MKRTLATSARFANLLSQTESQLIGTPSRPDGGKTRQLAGCDSFSFDEVVNHLFVANHRCSAYPGLRSARKASQRSPGATSFRQLRGFRNSGCGYQKCYKKSFVG